MNLVFLFINFNIMLQSVVRRSFAPAVRATKFAPMTSVGTFAAQQRHFHSLDSPKWKQPAQQQRPFSASGNDPKVKPESPAMHSVKDEGKLVSDDEWAVWRAYEKRMSWHEY